MRSQGIEVLSQLKIKFLMLKYLFCRDFDFQKKENFQF